MSDFKSYDVDLHILSPVHIGAGQELDPFSYIIRKDNLLLFDLLKWMNGYENKDELNKKMDSEDFVALRSYISEHFNNDDAILCSIPVKSRDVMERYRKAVQDKRSENQAIVNFMTKNEITKIPYIPGSSIKGSVRTAIASRFVSEAGVQKYNKEKYNEKIFGKQVLKNPMKNLKISDINLDPAGSFIYEAKEFSIKPDKTPTPKGGFEASASLCELNSDVSIPLRFILKNFKLFDNIIDLQFIVDTLYKFYMPKYKDEYKKFYSTSRAKEIQQAMATVNMEAVNLKSNETFIRIGRFSHVECVTLDKIRDPKTRKKNGEFLPWGKTRTLANGLYPFGWVKLEFKNLPANPRQDNDWPFSAEAIEKDLEIRKQAMLRAEQQKKDREEKQKAAQKRKAELEAMSPEERMIEEIKDPRVTENRVVSIYHALNSFPEDKKYMLAEELRAYWQKINKWKKKKCTKKQWKKVLAIKAILEDN